MTAWHDPLERDATILVAVSGGADSVYLLLLLHGMAEQRGWSLHVAHVNHRLRGEESDGDASFVEALCQRLDIPCQTVEIDVAGGEVELRRARLGILKAMARALGASAVALGHHRDDLAETFLINALRGSGPAGLEGMRPARRVDGDLWLVRPLLDIHRHEIEDELLAIGEAWREDSTNQTPIYRRNRIRLEAMPLLRSIEPAAAENIAWSAEFCGDVMDVYTRVVARAAEAALLAADSEAVLFDAAALRAADADGVAAGVLRHWRGMLSDAAAERTDPVAAPRDVLMQAVRRMRMGSGDDAAFHLGGEAWLHLGNHHGVIHLGEPVEPHLLRLSHGLPGLYLESEELLALSWERATSLPLRVAVGRHLVTISVDSTRGDGARETGEVAAWIDPAAIRGALVLRRMRHSDQVELVGGGRKSVRDALAEARSPAAIRALAAVVADDAGVLWIPGVRRGARARIGPQTASVLVVGIARGT